MTTINLERPTRTERVRGFQPPWRTVFVYHCSTCAREVWVCANSFLGKRAVPTRGAIRCPHCPQEK